VPDTTTIQNLEQSIIDGDVESAAKWAQQALNAELFLPDLILSSEAMKAASDILEEELKKSGVKVQSTGGKIVIGTVKGDAHDIGKTLVATLFKAYGFHVIDMGVDVPKEHFVEAVKEHQPDILGLSSLLTTSAAEQRDVIEALQKARLRSQVKIIVGGGAISEQWSKEIGADGYGGDAREAVDIGNKLLALS
jgi:methylmalonyl-CoA mutase cobalamin-binding domain/chain